MITFYMFSVCVFLYSFSFISTTPPHLNNYYKVESLIFSLLCTLDTRSFNHYIYGCYRYSDPLNIEEERVPLEEFDVILFLLVS